MNPKLHFIIPLIGNMLLITLIQLINTGLSSYSMSLFLGGLFIFTPILSYSFTTGLLSTLLTGLFFTATYTEHSFALAPLYFGLIYTGMFWLRENYRTYSYSHDELFLHLSNAILYTIFSVTLGKDFLLSPHYWLSAIINLIFSQIVLAFICRWFFQIQNALQVTFGLMENRIEPHKR